MSPEESACIGDVVVDAIEKQADAVVSIRLRRVSGDPVPPWEPGAHLALDLPNGLLRQYSLCGSLEDTNALTIAVLHEPESRGGSSYLHESLAVGDVFAACEIRNNFPIEPAPAYVFVAGGIGVTPLIPMIQRVEAANLPWRLVYGGRSRSSMAYLDLLQEYGDKVAVRPQDEFGLLDFARDVTDGLPEGAAVYACGPEPMLTALEEHCHQRGVRLHVEHFRASDEVLRGSGINVPFECELRRSCKTIRVGADECIIEALENVGIFTRSDCREGTCGSCETNVLDGQVEHRDALLSDEERRESKTMMICVSRATSERLVLDM